MTFTISGADVAAKVRELGYEAHKSGQAFTDNPYQPGDSNFNHWVDGMVAAIVDERE